MLTVNEAETPIMVDVDAVEAEAMEEVEVTPMETKEKRLTRIGNKTGILNKVPVDIQHKKGKT